MAPDNLSSGSGSDDSGGNPRFARLLKENTGLAPREVVELACAEMVRRWRKGQPTTVEAYLALHAALSEDDEAVLDLIDCELVLREEQGETATIDEYLERFPTRAEGLRRLFQLDRFVDTHTASSAMASPVPWSVQIKETLASKPGLDVPRSWPKIPGFLIDCELGRGGMGIVYRARQLGLRRVVAIKMIPIGDPVAAARFRAEAEAIARLRHPNVVKVYAVGEHDERPYLVMEYLSGGSLARRLDGNPWRPHEAARLVEALAGGVVAAHRVDVVHRDLKPSNILLDADDTPKIADYGLVKLMDSDEEVTRTGALVGSPMYMAPEQAMEQGGAVGPLADIHALGVILYELITGRPPYRGATLSQTLEQVKSSEPVPPSRLVPGLPRDLETVTLKCLEKDPASRYASAGELVDDLQRFLEDRPIRARRARAWERIVRWCRRNPAVAGLLVSLISMFLAGFVAVTVQWRRANAEAIRANQTARSEVQARAAESALRTQAQAEIAARDFDRGLGLAQRGDADLGSLWMAETLRQAPAERPEFRRMALANLVAWERQTPHLRAILEHHGRVDRVLFRADGRAILTGSTDGTARLWDASTGEPLGPPLVHGEQVSAIAFSPDGRLVLTGGSEVRIWDPVTGQPAGPALIHGDPIQSLGFSPDGRLLMTSRWNSDVRLWDAATGRPVGPPFGTAVKDAHFSLDGRLVLTGSADGMARFWDVATGQLAGLPLGHDTGVITRFSPDGRRIATGCEDGTAQLWDVATRRKLSSLPKHGERIQGVAFSPDSRLLLTYGADGTARIWDAVGDRPVGSLLRHGGEITRAAFSPDARLILTASFDHTARLWDAATGLPVGSPMRHRLSLRDATFAPDGTTFLTASADGTAKLWTVSPGEFSSIVQMADSPHSSAGPVASARPGASFQKAAFSPDRGQALLGNGSGLARLVEAATGQPKGVPLKHRWLGTNAFAFSPDGHRVATASLDLPLVGSSTVRNTCRIWNAETGRPSSPWLPHLNWVAGQAFRSDGKVLATGDFSGAVHLWDVETGANLTTLLEAGPIAFSVAFSPDGRTLAAGTTEPTNQVVIWDLATGKPRGESIRFRSLVYRLVFSGDGTRLAAGSYDSTARLIDVATGRVIGEPLHHDDRVVGMAFSPDDRLLLTANLGATGKSAARLWDARSGQPASPAMAHPGPIGPASLAFRPDGTAFATGCADGSIHVWDVATARPIGPSLMLRGASLGVAFSPDGRTVLAVDDHGNVRAWPMPELPTEPVERLIQRIQVRTGLSLDISQEVAVLDVEDWQRRRAELDDSSNISAPAADGLAWHEACARDAEALGNSFAAQWHLDRLIAARSGDAFLHARRARILLLAGSAERADADLTRALELGPRDSILDGFMQQAEDFRADGRPHDALRLLDRVIANRPGDWLTYALRAEAFAALGRAADREADLARAIEREADAAFLLRLATERCEQGHWRAAAALYDRVIAQGPIPLEVWTESAIAHLSIDDEAGYRNVCEIMRGRHRAAIPELFIRPKLASVCALAPGGVGNDGKAMVWMETLLAELSPSHKLRHAYLKTLGSILYRSGQFREAIDRINEGIATANGAPTLDDFLAPFFLAMAYHKAGDHTKARELLARPPAANPTAALGVEDGRVVHLLRREAERLILDSIFPADPFAH